MDQVKEVNNVRICQVEDSTRVQMEISEELDYELVASSVHISIQENDMPSLRQTMLIRNPTDRERIANYKINDRAALYLACQHGHVDIVNFLIQHCGADIELKGSYEVPEDKRILIVSPLWCAALENKLDVVKTLVHNGANINTPSSTNSTPVRSACFTKSIEVVKFLVENDADINKPNDKGGTCLMNAVGSLELCELLISKGADVNAVDNWGNTALHFAAMNNDCENAKFLLRKGADFHICTDSGNDVLRTAALEGNSEVIDAMFEEITSDASNSSACDQRNVYELLGTTCVDGKDNYDEAVQIWNKAFALRSQSSNDSPVSICNTGEMKSIYQFRKEVETCEELKQLTDPDEICTQAMMKRERILGPHHDATTSLLMYRGASFADARKYQRCVDLWVYAYRQRFQCLDGECLHTAKNVVYVFCEFQREIEKNATDERISVVDLIDVMETLTKHVLFVKKALESAPLNGITSGTNTPTVSDVQMLVTLYLHLINMVRHHVSTTEEHEQIVGLINTVVTADPRCENNLSMLHLAINPSSSEIEGDFYTRFPSAIVVIALLDSGASVFAQGNDGSSVLHHAELHLITEATQDQKLVSLILLLVYNTLCLLSNAAFTKS